jgi:hypothetical protein
LVTILPQRMPSRMVPAFERKLPALPHYRKKAAIACRTACRKDQGILWCCAVGQRQAPALRQPATRSREWKSYLCNLAWKKEPPFPALSIPALSHRSPARCLQQDTTQRGHASVPTSFGWLGLGSRYPDRLGPNGPVTALGSDDDRQSARVRSPIRDLDGHLQGTARRCSCLLENLVGGLGPARADDNGGVRRQALSRDIQGPTGRSLRR